MKESNALALQNQEIIIGGFTQTMLDTLKATIAKGTTDEQFSLFLHTCIRGKLDPFLGHIDCIVYQGKDGPVMSIQHRAEAYVAVAKRDSDYEGMKCSEVKENDSFSADFTAGTVNHTMESFKRGATVGAYCIAYKKGMPPVLVTVNTDQVDKYLKSSKGGQATMWRENFDDMIVKHAIKRAFKRQFGIDIAEDDVSDPDEKPYVRKDITDEVNGDPTPLPIAEVKPTKQPKETKAPKNQELIDITPLTPEQEIVKVNEATGAALDELGLARKTPERTSFIAKHMTKAGATHTINERIKFLAFIEEEIERKNQNEGDELPA